MRNISKLAAAALVAASLSAPAIADDEDMGIEERCRTRNLQADRSKGFRFPFEDQEPGLVTVKSSSENVDLYVVDADGKTVCMSVDAGIADQSCIWVADGAQRYKARVVNVSATPGWDGVSDIAEDESTEDGETIEVSVCFVYER